MTTRCCELKSTSMWVYIYIFAQNKHVHIYPAIPVLLKSQSELKHPNLTSSCSREPPIRLWSGTLLWRPCWEPHLHLQLERLDLSRRRLTSVARTFLELKLENHFGVALTSDGSGGRSKNRCACAEAAAVGAARSRRPRALAFASAPCSAEAEKSSQNPQKKRLRQVSKC